MLTANCNNKGGGFVIVHGLYMSDGCCCFCFVLNLLNIFTNFNIIY